VPVATPTVTVALASVELEGAKLMTPEVQVLPVVSAKFAVHVPFNIVKFAPLLFENGVALKVTGPPLAVKVTVPHEPVEPT